MKREDIKKIARARLKDAEALFDARRYEGAAYVCGYAVELALKHRICMRLDWNEYPPLRRLNNFKTHDLNILVLLAGVEKKVNTSLLSEWSAVSWWNSEIRYKPARSFASNEVRLMIESTKILLRKL